MNDVIIFVIHGIIGALLHILLHAERICDIKNFASLRYIIIGGIAGYIYYILYSEYAFPNSFLTIVFGYFSEDVFNVLFEKKFKELITQLSSGDDSG